MPDPIELSWMKCAIDYRDTLAGKTPADGLPTTAQEVCDAIFIATGHQYTVSDIAYMVANVKDDPELAGFNVPYFAPGSSSTRVYFVIPLDRPMEPWMVQQMWDGMVSSVSHTVTRTTRERGNLAHMSSVTFGADRAYIEMTGRAVEAALTMLNGLVDMLPDMHSPVRQDTLL